MPSATLPNGITIISEPRSRDYDFAARAASELNEIEKHALIEYLMETIMDGDETAEGETIFEIMNTGARLLGGKMAYFGPEDITDHAASMGIDLNDDQVATFRNDVRWEELGDTMSQAGTEALRDMVANPCEDIYEGVEDGEAPQPE